MPQNRYNNKLREGNQSIIDLSPANYVLRIELAIELKNLIQKNNLKILEIGTGEGDLTKYIFKNNPSISIDCLDISQEMLESAKVFLAEYTNRINFICADALEFLSKNKSKYDLIVTAWTIHNFTQDDKLSTLSKIFSSLNPNGKFLLMDKVYPDSEDERDQLLETQLKRYRYLSEELKKNIINHEKQDLLDEYRMNESRTLNLLKKIGFRKVKILDRVERDILLLAEK